MSDCLSPFVLCASRRLRLFSRRLSMGRHEVVESFRDCFVCYWHRLITRPEISLRKLFFSLIDWRLTIVKTKISFSNHHNRGKSSLMLSWVSIELTAARALLLMTQNVNVSRFYAANEDVEQIDYKQTNKALRLASIAEREMLSRGPEWFMPHICRAGE